MTFEAAIAEYIFHKKWLAKAIICVEESKKVFIATPSNTKAESNYDRDVRHMRDVEFKTNFAKRNAAISKVIESNSKFACYGSCTLCTLVNNPSVTAEKYKVKAIKATSDAECAERDANDYAREAAAYAAFAADDARAANAVEDPSLDAKAIKSKARASAIAGYASKAAIKAAKAKAAADKANAMADYYAREVVNVAEFAEAVKVAEEHITAEY